MIERFKIELPDGENILFSEHGLASALSINEQRRRSLEQKITNLKYTSEATKETYRHYLDECKSKQDFRELLQVIDSGESQLGTIQTNMFSFIEACVQKINQMTYLPLARKRLFIEQLIAAELQDEMEDILLKAISENFLAELHDGMN